MANAMASGVANEVGLGVHRHLQAQVPVAQTCDVVVDVHRNAVVAGGEDAPLPDSDSTDLGGGVFAPARNVASNREKALIPMGRRLGRSHLRRIGHLLFTKRSF